MCAFIKEARTHLQRSTCGFSEAILVSVVNNSDRLDKCSGRVCYSAIVVDGITLGSGMWKVSAADPKKSTHKNTLADSQQQKN